MGDKIIFPLSLNLALAAIILAEIFGDIIFPSILESINTAPKLFGLTGDPSLNFLSNLSNESMRVFMRNWDADGDDVI